MSSAKAGAKKPVAGKHVAPKIGATVTGADNMPEIREGQTVALLQELHILTRDGKMNQDSRHGVRPPTESNEKLLTSVTQRKWPTWLVPLGNLTGVDVYTGVFVAQGWLLAHNPGL